MMMTNLKNHLARERINFNNEDVLEDILNNERLLESILKFNRRMKLTDYQQQFKGKGLPAAAGKVLRQALQFQEDRTRRQQKKKLLKDFLDGLGVATNDKDLDLLVADDYLYTMVMAFDKDKTKETYISNYIDELPITIRDGLLGVIRNRQAILKAQAQRKRINEEAERKRVQAEAQKRRREEEAQRKRIQAEKAVAELKKTLKEKIQSLGLDIPTDKVLNAMVADGALYNFVINFDKETTTLQQLVREQGKLEQDIFSRMKGAIQQRLQRDTPAINLPTEDKYAERLKTKHGYQGTGFNNKNYLDWLKEKFLNKKIADNEKYFLKILEVFHDHNLFKELDINKLKKECENPSNCYGKFNTQMNDYVNNIGPKLSKLATDINENDNLKINMEKLKDVWKNEPRKPMKPIKTKTTKKK